MKKSELNKLAVLSKSIQKDCLSLAKIEQKRFSIKESLIKKMDKASNINPKLKDGFMALLKKI